MLDLFIFAVGTITPYSIYEWVLFCRPLAWELKRLLIDTDILKTVFYFSYPWKSMKLISKWNGKNYYWIDTDGSIHEIVKQGGWFYRTKYVIGEWLRPIGNPLKKADFTLQE